MPSNIDLVGAEIEMLERPEREKIPKDPERYLQDLIM
jgi:hypothetical protein